MFDIFILTCFNDIKLLLETSTILQNLEIAGIPFFIKNTF